MTFEWTELAYQDAMSGNTMFLIFPLCVLLVYGVLAAQYESWSLPLTVILIVPMTLLSAIAGVWLTGGDNNVFTQISFLVLAGLACKNAILIVEFARQREAEGALAAHRDSRCLPDPPAAGADDVGRVHHGRRAAGVSSGAGAEVRQAMGIAVFAGMLGVTRVRAVPDAGLLRRDQGSSRIASPAGGGRDRAAAAGCGGGPVIVRTQRDVWPWRAIACSIVIGVRVAAAAACAVRTTPPATTVERTPLGRWDASAVRRRRRTTRAGGGSSRIPSSSSSSMRRSTRTTTSARRSRASIRRAPCSTKIAARSLSDRHGRRVRRRPRAGAARVRRRADPHQHLPRRLRRVLGARSLRPRPVGDRRRVGQRRELRGRARRRARQRRRRRGAQLLRAARHPAAAVGARSQPREPARDAAIDRGAPRRGDRRRAGRRQRVGPRRRDRSGGAAAAHGARRPRTPARRPHRQARRDSSPSISRRAPIRCWRSRSRSARPTSC